MHFSFSTSAATPGSDAGLIRRAGEGHLDSFRHLYRRHYPAVRAYAVGCMQTSYDAYELTCQTFSDLLQRALAGESFIERRFPGCLRLQLLECARVAAVTRCAGDDEGASPQFRRWVAQGARWSMEENGQLAVAWDALPRDKRCLLWHTVAEQEEAALVARVTGVPPGSIEKARETALGALRQIRADLYMERLQRQECRGAVEQLMAHRPVPLGPPEPLKHAAVCTECAEVFNDVMHLETRLAAQLPRQVLGWWPGDAYLNMKSALTAPQNDPPFLARAVRQAGLTTDSRSPSRGHRTARAPGGFRSKAALVLLSFAAGAAAGYAAIPAFDDTGGGYVVPDDRTPRAPSRQPDHGE
ncbi:hypothetical protein ABCR94_09975 [Streptomyces sp. 21So2-11]|uniref:RNA polymerase sigma factor n=1 Tax=Streptomyces sp. 21So2-11 TaxID=3144408 RepID=UPI00321973C3